MARTAEWGNEVAHDMADKINRYIDHGVTIFQLVIASPDQMGMMRKIAEEVLPHVKRDPPSRRAA